jgi:hypothetical protein
MNSQKRAAIRKILPDVALRHNTLNRTSFLGLLFSTLQDDFKALDIDQPLRQMGHPALWGSDYIQPYNFCNLTLSGIECQLFSPHNPMAKECLPICRQPVLA